MSRSLTIKQQNVCSLVALGKTNREIADQLGISERTVESHKLAIYGKLGVRNAVELTRKVLGVVA